MISFEQEIKKYFDLKSIIFIDNSSEFKLLDFTIPEFVSEVHGEKNIARNLFLEVKEKRQSYNTNNWNIIEKNQEQYIFIVDELSCRKILAYAPFSGLLVRNNLSKKYYWYSILDLFLMPKRRVNRPIQRNSVLALKGKILLDLRNAVECSSLDDAFLIIKNYILNRNVSFIQTNECYGKYYGEEIITQGITRNSGHWDIDVTETR